MNKEPIADFARFAPKQDYFLNRQSLFSNPEDFRNYHSPVTGRIHLERVRDFPVRHPSDVGNLFRPAPGTPMERPRCLMTAEIGWGIPWLVDWGLPKAGHQIDFRSLRPHVTDKTTLNEIRECCNFAVDPPWHHGQQD